MNNEKQVFQATKKAFNTIKVLKGQYVSIATCDKNGNPNVAPIGSMRVVDETTVHILQGFLSKSLSNLKENPKAAFSVCLKPGLLDFFSLFKEKEKEILGYRLYCNYIGFKEEKDIIKQESQMIADKVPFFLKGLFRKFIEKNISRLLEFKITDIREIS